MKRIVLLASLAAAVLTFFVASGAADQGYTDPNGDGKSGTDIVSITVRELPNSIISIQIQSVSPIVANHAVAVFIDADKNQSTGGQGDEYWMYGGPLVGAAFFSWNGSQFVRSSTSTFSAGAAASNITEFRFSKTDIGGVASGSFNFLVESISIDPPNVNFWDAAPDGGYYTYNLAPPPAPTPTPTPTPAPAAPSVSLGAKATALAPGIHAGKAFIVTDKVTASGSSVKVACTAKAGTKTFRVTGRYTQGTATCLGVVPARTAGKRLTLTITATSGGATAKKTFTFLIRA